MKTRKTNLDDLKVKSFVTDDLVSNEKTIKGGDSGAYDSRVDKCPTALICSIWLC